MDQRTAVVLIAIAFALFAGWLPVLLARAPQPDASRAFVPNTTVLSGKKVTSVSARESWSSVKKSAKLEIRPLPIARAPIFQAGGTPSGSVRR